jgi:plastocyanin
MNRFKCVVGLLALAALAAVALAEDEKDKRKDDAKVVMIDIEGKGGNSLYILRGAAKDKQVPINVNVGQKVTWTNNSKAPHTVTSDKKGKDGNPVFISKELEKGDTFSVTFDDAMFKALGGNAGEQLTTTYHCDVHPDKMKNVKLILKPAAAKKDDKKDKDKKEE